MFKIDLIKLFSNGLIDYTDHGIDKPVKFTDEILRDIAAQTSVVELTDEHTKNVLGSLENFVFIDGELHVKPPDNTDIKDKGISPVFKMDLKDMGEYYSPISPLLVNAGLTDKPRTKIFYNNIIEKDEDHNMVENNDVLEKAVAENQSLKEEIGVLKAQAKSAGKTVEEKEALEEKIKALEKDSKDKEDEIGSLKSKAEEYDKIQATKKEEIIKELAGEDEETLEELKDLPLNKLEFLKNKKIITQKPKGVGSEGAPGENDDGLQRENDKTLTQEEFDKIKKEEGVF